MNLPLISKKPSAHSAGSAFGPGDGTLLVELSGSVLKAVYGVQQGGYRATHAETFALTGSNDLEASKFLLDCLRKFKVKKRRAVIVLPTSVFICKNMDMPSDNREEIAKIIELQAGRFTPYSAEEIVIDYLCHVVKDQHYTHVLLFIVHRQIIDRCLKLLQGAGIEPAGFRAGIEAVAGRIQRLGLMAPGDGATGLLHVSHEGASFLILDKGQMIFVRSFATTLKDMESANDGIREEFSGELAKSISAYQDIGFGKPLKKLIISGASPAVASLTEKLGVKDAVPETEYLDYFQTIKVDEALKQKAQGSGMDFFDLFAAGAEQASLELDLTPKEIRAQQKIRQESRDLAATAVLIMTVVLLVSFHLFGKIHFKSMTLEKLDEVNTATFDEARYLERISTKSRAVRSLLDGRGKGLYVFNKISELFGEEIYLREFTYDLEGNLAIKGTADSMSRVFSFVKQLEESNYFESVTTNETKSRREGKKEVADFDISGKLKEGI